MNKSQYTCMPYTYHQFCMGRTQCDSGPRESVHNFVVKLESQPEPEDVLYTYTSFHMSLWGVSRDKIRHRNVFFKNL